MAHVRAVQAQNRHSAGQQWCSEWALRGAQSGDASTCGAPCLDTVVPAWRAASGACEASARRLPLLRHVLGSARKTLKLAIDGPAPLRWCTAKAASSTQQTVGSDAEERRLSQPALPLRLHCRCAAPARSRRGP